MRRLSFALSLLLIPALASAHARLLDPLNRLGMNDANGGQKTAPCGMSTKPPTASYIFETGQTITVKIQETIAHPGHYELYWSPANDQNFTILPGQDNIANPQGALETTSVQLTLPSTQAENGTLQLIMVMLDNPAAPSYYYSCADIRLVPPGSDLSVGVADLAGGNVDLAAHGDLAGSGGPDLAGKPPAADAGLPGCSMAAGQGSGALALAVLLGLLCGGALLPSLARARRRR